MVFNFKIKNKYTAIFWLVLTCLTFSCEYTVEKGLPSSPCNPEPVTYEIYWKMDTSGQLASVNIKPGDTVRWIWAEENMPHDVTSNDPNAPDDFGSEMMIGEGSIYEYTFTEETTFNYHCSIHPTTMFGTITVAHCVEESN